LFNDIIFSRKYISCHIWLQKLELLFLKFDIEPNCDFVIIRDGHGGVGGVLGNFSGSNHPRQIVSRTRWMYVEFTVCRFPLHKPGFEVQYRNLYNYPRKYHFHKNVCLIKKCI